MFSIRLWWQAARLWSRSDAEQYAAALAYFVPFAVVPLMFISITWVGVIIGTDEVVSLLASWGAVIDPDIPKFLETSLVNWSTVTGQYRLPIAAILFFSFMILVALNSITAGIHKIWGIEIRGPRALIQRYFRAALFIVLLQAYLVFIILLGDTIDGLVALTGLTIIKTLNPLLFLISTVVLFALGYGLLPLSAPSFRARLYGALVSGFLFFGIRYVVSVHFATSPSVTLFGAASLIIVLLVWCYVGAGVILYGAAFAKVYENKVLLKKASIVGARGKQ